MMEHDRMTGSGSRARYAFAMAGSAMVGAASEYVSTMNSAWQAEMMRWVFQWYSPPGSETPGRASSPAIDASGNREAGPLDDVLADDADGPWPDIIEYVAEDPLAHTPAGDFNIALHNLEEAVYSGQFARDNPDQPPPGYKAVLRPWPSERRTEPYEL